MKAELAWLHVLIIPPADLSPNWHSKMCVVCPHNSMEICASCGWIWSRSFV